MRRLKHRDAGLGSKLDEAESEKWSEQQHNCVPGAALPAEITHFRDFFVFRYFGSPPWYYPFSPPPNL